MSQMFQPELEKCPICESKLVKKYNTPIKKVITLNETIFCGERVLKCRNDKCPGNSMSFHSAEYKSLNIEGMTFGIDVVALEGELGLKNIKPLKK